MEEDHCTLWLDGVPTWLGGSGTEWQRCCIEHDKMYTAAHHFGEYVAAHWELCKCVADVSLGMAGVMFAGVLAATFALGKKKLPASYWNRK